MGGPSQSTCFFGDRGLQMYPTGEDAVLDDIGKKVAFIQWGFKSRGRGDGVRLVVFSLDSGDFQCTPPWFSGGERVIAFERGYVQLGYPESTTCRIQVDALSPLPAFDLVRMFWYWEEYDRETRVSELAAKFSVLKEHTRAFSAQLEPIIGFPASQKYDWDKLPQHVKIALNLRTGLEKEFKPWEALNFLDECIRTEQTITELFRTPIPDLTDEMRAQRRAKYWSLRASTLPLSKGAAGIVEDLASSARSALQKFLPIVSG